MTSSGGGGLAGPLGGLFGLHSGHRAKPLPAVEAAARRPANHSSTAERSVLPRRPHKAPAARLHARHPAVAPLRHVAIAPRPHRAPSTTPSAPSTKPAAPAPGPPPPVQNRQPPRAPAGNVERAAQTIRDTMAPAAPPLRPLLDQTTTTVGRACGLVGGCP